jgi:hypothetical protein
MFFNSKSRFYNLNQKNVLIRVALPPPIMQVANDGLRRKRPKQGASKPRADREQYHEARGPARYSTSVSLFFFILSLYVFSLFSMVIYYYFIKTNHTRIIKKADTSLRACLVRCGSKFELEVIY